jgi:TatA/E family protein of Tat protein translocase
MFGLGTPELIIILGIAFLIFGGKKLPEIGAGLGIRASLPLRRACRRLKSRRKKSPHKNNIKNTPSQRAYVMR